MARLLRVEYRGAVYHVTVRSNWGAALYRDDKDREYWLYRLGESAETHGVQVHLYCMMTNHFHVVVGTPHGNLGRFMHSVLTGYTVFFNRRHQTHGHVTQGRYGARLVAGDDYLLKLSRYVHLNPVKVKVARALPLEPRRALLSEYAWSSFRAYAGMCRGPEWLVSEPTLALLGGGRHGRRRLYRQYVEAGIAEDDMEFQRELMRSARSIGNADFREEVDTRYRALLGKRRRPEDVALRHMGSDAAPPESVLAAVAKAAGVEVGELSRRRRESPLKAVAAFLLVRHARLTQRDIAPLLGLRSGSSVSCQLRRLAEEGRADKHVADLISRAEKSLARRS
jgi:putative transposase